MSFEIERKESVCKAVRRIGRSLGLDDVSFEARPGQTVALVGPSGAGKTTAVRLAMRLIDPQEGRVLIEAGPDAIRHNARVQEVYLVRPHHA